MHIDVKDNSGSTVFMIFDKEMEKLVQVSAMELLNIQNDDTEKTPPIINKHVYSRTYVFQIKVTDCNVI